MELPRISLASPAILSMADAIQTRSVSASDFEAIKQFVLQNYSQDFLTANELGSPDVKQCELCPIYACHGLERTRELFCRNGKGQR